MDGFMRNNFSVSDRPILWVYGKSSAVTRVFLNDKFKCIKYLNLSIILDLPIHGNYPASLYNYQLVVTYFERK